MNKQALPNRQRGFGIIVLLVVIVIAGMTILIGFMVMNRQKASDNTDKESGVILPQPPVEIDGLQDLQKVRDDLQKTKFDYLDTTKLEKAEADLL